MLYPIDELFYINYPYVENYSPVNKPPTLYAILNSLVNYNANEKVKIMDLAENGRDLIFDFNYFTFPKFENEQQELEKSDEEKYVEECILNHFMERRIGYDTVTSFKLHLRDRLNDIMPLFIASWNIIMQNPDDFIFDEFREISHEETTSLDSSGGTIDKYSDTPQGQLTNVSTNTYLTDYRDISVTGDEDGTRDFTENNQYIRPREAYFQLIEAKNPNLFTKLYNDLECLFYQLD